jgi:hypothetical protein
VVCLGWAWFIFSEMVKEIKGSIRENRCSDAEKGRLLDCLKCHPLFSRSTLKEKRGSERCIGCCSRKGWHCLGKGMEI